jgi:cytochrome P450
VARLQARIADVVDELLAPLVSAPDGFDIIRDFTMIPTVILAEMIGVPRSRQEDFRRWSSTIAGSLAYGNEDQEALARMRAARASLVHRGAARPAVDEDRA